MADFSTIKAQIDSGVTTNGIGAITGAILNAILNGIVDAVDAAKQDVLVFDATPTEDSTHPVTSGGVYDALAAAAQDVATTLANYYTKTEADTMLAAKADDSAVVHNTGDENIYGIKSFQKNVMMYGSGNYANKMLVSKLSMASNGEGIDANGKPVTDLPTPSVDSDAATKKYVDDGLAAKQDTLTIDATPTDGSGNPVASNGVYNALAGKQDAIGDLATIRSGAAAGATAVQPATMQTEIGNVAFQTGEKVNATKVVNDLTTGGSTDVLSAEQGKVLHNTIYTTTSESITPTKIGGLYLNISNVVKSSTNNVWNAACFAARPEAWTAIVVATDIKSSVACGGIALIDSLDEIDVGDTIDSSKIVSAPHECNQHGNPWSMDKTIQVPAGKILVVFEIKYNAYIFNYYEKTGEQTKFVDIESKISEIETALNASMGNPDYVQENPLDIIKETAGYTAIFRKMGVIGGSMSTGWHSHTSGSVSANMPEFSTLQFMARLCGAEGFNFSSGGLGAISWPSQTISNDFHDENKKCQLYLVQLGNNDLAYHKDHSEYTLGTVADLTPTAGTSIADYTYDTSTFFGNMARIINEIRKVQPRAYVFLSTFLKGYGTIPDDFDYNQAVRDIVAYYQDALNRPEGDELHYYLLDYYTYGKPFSYYASGIHAGTVKGSHLVATGYLLWAYEYCTYIDWIIKNNMSDFNEVAFVGTDNYNG